MGGIKDSFLVFCFLITCLKSVTPKAHFGIAKLWSSSYPEIFSEENVSEANNLAFVS